MFFFRDHFCSRKKAEISTTELATSVKTKFWETLHGGKYEEIPKDQVVLRKGHTSNYIYIVLRGTLKIFDTKTGNTKSLLTDTNMFGYSALFSRYRHASSEKRKLAIEPYNIISVGPCSLYVIRKTHATLNFPDDTIESIRKLCVRKQQFYEESGGVDSNTYCNNLQHRQLLLFLR